LTPWCSQSGSHSSDALVCTPLVSLRLKEQKCELESAVVEGSAGLPQGDSAESSAPAHAESLVRARYATLQALKYSELTKLARSKGISEGKINYAALDSDDLKAAMLELVWAAEIPGLLKA